MKRIAIVGGGIAGLSAAFYLEKARQAGANLQWTLFEKSDRLGGVIRTERRDGFVLEAGPDSFLSMKPDALALMPASWASVTNSSARMMPSAKPTSW